MSARIAETKVVRTHLVVGERELVGTALASACRDGRLRGLGHPVELGDGRVQVTAELVEPAAAHNSASSRWAKARPWLLGVAVLLAVATAVCLVWLLALAVAALISTVQAVAAWIGTHLWLIGLVLLGLLLLGGTTADRCTGLHCGGCRR